MIKDSYKDFFILQGMVFAYQLELKSDYFDLFQDIKFKKTYGSPASAWISENLKLFQTYSKTTKDLQDEICKCIDDVIKNKFQYNTDYRITSSWATLTKPEEFGSSHVHSNSWLSGVYYPEYHPEHKIKFYSDSFSSFIDKPKEYNIYNSSSYDICPVKNSLVIFHSHIRHEICYNTSDRNRYSIAFNILPKGEIGVGDSLVKI